MSISTSEPASTAGTERQLLIMRHAKAAYPESGSDHERPLASRGRKDAADVGQWLAEENLVPELVMCSDAARTVETAQTVVEGSGAEQLPIVAVPALYEAHVGEVLEAVHTVPAEITRVLVVGHEPTMSATVASLTGQYLRFTTAGVGVLEFKGDWRSLEPDACTLDQFRTPKDA